MKKLHHFTKTPQGKFITLIGALVVVLFAYYFYAVSKGQTAPQEVTIKETDHVFGNPAAKVTLVEFGDFQCPACKAYESIVKSALTTYSNDVKLVFRHFPLTQIHQNALLAAKASEAAGLQNRFWEMHDMLYEKQEEWGGSLNARDYFINYARTLKLDVNKFTAALSDKTVEEKILAEYKEGVALEVQGTPTFFLNGKKIENPRSLEEFQTIIKEAVSK